MKRVMKVISLITILILLVGVLGGCSTEQKPASSAQPAQSSAQPKESSTQPKEKTFSLKLSDNQTEDNPVVIGMKKFAELTEKKTNGTVKIEVYPNAQLAEEVPGIEQVMAGALDMLRVNSVPLSAVVKELEAFTLPYVFTSYEHKYKVLDGDIGKEVLKALEAKGMVGLGYVESGSRHFYTTKKQVKSVADLKGLKIRVQKADSAIKMIQMLGAVATPMDYAEVFQALQTGVIDGAENDFVSFNTSGHYEVAKYLAMDSHNSPPALLVMNKKIWDSMSDNQRKAMQEAADEAIKFQRDAMNKFQEESRKKVEAAGVKVVDVDVSEFQKAVAPMYADYPHLTDILKKMKELQ